jgi:hypothetical protein
VGTDGRNGLDQLSEPEVARLAAFCNLKDRPIEKLIEKMPLAKANGGSNMLSKYLACYCFTAIATCLLASSSLAYTGQGLASKAKITIDEARAIALKARPGAITDEELEKEKGGSGLRFSFDVKAGNVTYEVGIDAQTGKVLENSKEGRHPD